MDTSLSSPSPPGVLGPLGLFKGGEGQGSKSRGRRLLEGDEDGVWSIVLESQLLPLLTWLAAAVALGKGGLAALDLSHAARVAGSTGQASTSGSPSFAILCGFIRVE